MMRRLFLLVCIAAGSASALAQQASGRVAPEQASAPEVDKNAAPVPPSVLVRKGLYVVLGKEVATSAEVIALLRQNGVAKVRVGSGSDDYERIGRLIYAAQRAGMDVTVDPPAGK